MVLNVHSNHKAYWGRGEGGGVMEAGGDGDYMTYALKWAAMRAILVFHNCEGQSHKTVSTDHKF